MKLKKLVVCFLIIITLISVTSLKAEAQNPGIPSNNSLFALIAQVLNALKGALNNLASNIQRLGTAERATVSQIQVIKRLSPSLSTEQTPEGSITNQDTLAQEYVSGSIVAAFKPGAGPSSTGALNSKFGFRGSKRLGQPNHPNPILRHTYRLDIAANKDPLKAAAEYRKNPNVLIAEPNFIYRPTQVSATPQPFISPPNDPYYGAQWHLPKIRTLEAWETAVGDPNTVIAVIDTGVALTHPDLTANLWSNPDEIAGNGIDDDVNGYIDDMVGWNFTAPSPPCWPGPPVAEDCVGQNNNPFDAFMHGTHVSGIIAEVTNNGIGGAGICRQCKIMVLKNGFTVPNPLIPGTSAAILTLSASIEAINYAALNGARIISMSWGGAGASALLKTALDAAYGQGVVLVAGAGNGNSDSAFYPAAYPNVIAVTATDQNDSRASFSQYGYWTDIGAPGVGIISTFLTGASLSATCNDLDGDGYGPCSGTSMATPVVAGILGLAVSVNPSLTPDQLRTLIASAYDPVNSPSGYIGPGRINAEKAVNNTALPVALFADAMDMLFVGSVPTPITGTAAGSGFLKYKVEYASLASTMYPTSWNMLENDTFTPVVNGALATWNPSIINVPPGYYALRLTVTETNGEKVQDIAIVSVDSTLETGWPIQIPAQWAVTKPALQDIDGDGNGEIFLETWNPVTGEDNYYALNHDGTPLPGFPISEPGVWGFSFSPAVADVDADGVFEILYCSSTAVGSAFGVSKCGLYHPNGTLVPGWPINLPSSSNVYGDNMVAMANVDGGNDLETLFATRTPTGNPGNCGGTENKLYIFKPSGQPLAGWPKAVPCQPFGLAVGDVDANGDMEIALSTLFNPLTMTSDPITWNGQLYLWNHDGTNVPNWPKQVAAPTAPVLADLDQNDGGKLEIIQFGDDLGTLHVLNDNGNYVSGWPLLLGKFGFLENSVSDVNGDGDLEILSRHMTSTGLSQVRVYNHNATLLSGWPVSIPDLPFSILSSATPLIADLDGGGNDIIFGVEGTQKIYAFHANGTPLANFPKLLADKVRGIVIGNVNGDAEKDLFTIDWSGKMYLWSFPAPAGSSNPWSMYRNAPGRPGKAPAAVPGTPLPSPSPSPSTPPTLLPGAPGTLSGFAISGTQVNLFWGPASNAASYQVQVATNNSFNPNSIVPGWNNADVGSGLTTVVTGLAPETTYRFRVRGVNSFGVGPYGNKATIQTLP